MQVLFFIWFTVCTEKEKNGKISTPVDLRKAAVPRLQGVALDTAKFTLEVGRALHGGERREGKKIKRKGETPLYFRGGSLVNCGPFSNIQHVASMSLDDRVMALSPNDSIRKMKELVNRKDIWTHNVILTITDTEITVKDGSTSVSVYKNAINRSV